MIDDDGFLFFVLKRYYLKIMISLTTPLSSIHGIGPRFLTRLNKLRLFTVRDLLWHFPTRYEDWSRIANIAELGTSDHVTVRGVVQEIKNIRTWRKRMVITEALIGDESGTIKAIWFNQPYIGNALTKGAIANFAGKVAQRKNETYLSNPTYEVVRSEDQVTKHTGRLVPTYPETHGLTSRGIRYLIAPIFDDLEEIQEFIPGEILESQDLPHVEDALHDIHMPESLPTAERARERFSFEELFLLQLNNLRQKLALKKQTAPKIVSSDSQVKKLLKELPFELTGAQYQALHEVFDDLSKPQPMNRLLQGDVGSGKTIVAALAAVVTASSKYQTGIMAPTEVLARQHYKTLTKLFPDFSLGIGLLVSKEARAFYGEGLETEMPKQELIKKIASGEIKILIGTHALIQKNVDFENLGLVVVDEQHRFGVAQRAELIKRHQEKTGHSHLPHFLSMSATPIPRTLMMTIFGDLDSSLINELPKNRKAIITKIVAPENREKAYAFIRGQARHERQTFVICPRIQPSEIQDDGVASSDFKKLLELDVKTVKKEFEKLSKKVFPDLKVGMLHGKLKNEEKKKVMADFAGRKTDILVSTSVIEVGVDIPNATIMMIEGSEWFGLAQLYQFRGRVGRGEHQSFCFLFTESHTRTTQARLQSLITAKNGFELAEMDLKFRGPGELLGNEQTGLPDIAMRALQNEQLIKDSREAARKIMEIDPEFTKHPLLMARMQAFQKETHLE